MARRRERIFALVMAIAFLITTVGVGASVIWQIVQDNKNSKKAETAAQQAADSADKNALQGKKMDNFTPIAKVDSLQIQDLEVGTGEEVKKGDTITFDYTGALAADGTIFQSSLDTGQPVTYSLNDLIPGWQAGIPGMKVGGKRRLLIPAAQAYGSAERPGIPANSDLVFDITIHKKQ
ncbi:MAG TPA: FKBP-type peptidyl-prolyl cis-trans isomerase [Candidatus Saccharimonadales bacterium]|nr:FKBP-type peptidyl-prolyl cis-trans isomerase [Candidatus Saccharimonadales bacterium]